MAYSPSELKHKTVLFEVTLPRTKDREERFQGSGKFDLADGQLFIRTYEMHQHAMTQINVSDEDLAKVKALPEGPQEFHLVF